MLGLFLVALFVALNGFFVAAEFALVKLRATRPPGRAVPRGRREAMIAHAVDRLDRYLGVTQLGITLASLALGWVGEPALTSIGDRVAVAALGGPLGTTGHHAVEGVAFALLTFAHVLFGELVPKLVAIQRSRQAAIVAAPLLRGAYWIVWPALWGLEVGSRAILRAVGLPFEAHTEAALSEDEIVGILAAGAARGREGAAKQELLHRVMRFSQRTAKAVMVPRVDVATLSVDATGREALDLLQRVGYSRVLLVRGASLDDVAGYLYVKDVLFGERVADLLSIEPLRREVLFVPESQGLVEVMRRMQRTHTPFAVVVDEYGGTSGIVTLEDLLEEIVGEIRDELDVERAAIEKAGDAWEVGGGVALDDLRAIGVEVADDERNLSVGAAVLARLGRFPRAGDAVDLGGMRAQVVALARRRVTRVRLRAPAAPADRPRSTPPGRSG